MGKIMAEYIWLDGNKPTPLLRSKTKVLDTVVGSLSDIPHWGFDGSSTMQASGDNSDCALHPVYYCKDPLRGGEHILVMCEVMLPDGRPHESNTRARLRETENRYSAEEGLFGIEQEYTLLEGGRPIGFPVDGYPGPQGPYYCSVGAERAIGREIAERHLQACLDAGLSISGINAEVMPGQWEFQTGALSALMVSDQLYIMRWLLERIAEEHNVTVSLDPKPAKGDWNGAGAHTNFSTKAFREVGGMDVMMEACTKLEAKHAEHIAVYGANNDERLTGLHETCSIDEFRHGVSDRGASIRIPLATAQKGYGYFEDRRPAANMDPYQVTRILLETVCGGWS